MRNILRFSFYSLLFMLGACAIQVAPTGGDKDVLPPSVKKSVPENFSPGFNGRDISITFDEYIVLKDLNAQLIVSPPLKHQPDIKVKKKTLFIHLEDTLLKNTTYTMNFGNAITDMHESNPVENFQYVFSTGEVLDSLTVSGHVEAALDMKTEKGIFVMLYRDKDDSLPLKRLPDYFAKTGDDGMFEIKNVSPGSYKIFALKDNNSNYLFDNPDELMAFDTANVTAGEKIGVLRMFKEYKKQQVLKTSADEPGKATVIFARPMGNEPIVYLTDSAAMQIQAVSYSEKRDTLVFWYRNLQSDSLSFMIRRETGTDTVSFRLKHLQPNLKNKYEIKLSTQFATGAENTLPLNMPLQLTFNHPIDSFDLSTIAVTEDSLPVKNAKIFFSDTLKQHLTLDFPRKENKNYVVLIPKNTMKDILELRNDSLQYFFRTRSVENYGTMAITLKTPDDKTNYILQLIDEKESVYRQSFFKGDTILNYDFLDPKLYRLKVTEDLNGNREWDPGNYKNHVQPERVFYYKETLTVRANWDVEASWSVISSQ